MDNYGISICISAYNTAEYIEECLDSVAKQTWFKDHDNWEILLGIDGCYITLGKVSSIMNKYKNLRVFMMDKNVGTYVTCNTIMMEAKYNWLLRFDSDDVMPSDMLEKIFKKNLDEVALIRYKFHNFGDKVKTIGTAWGSHMVKKEIFEKYGGYRNWRIAADYDFCYRVNYKEKELVLNDVEYKRRVRSNSLEHAKETTYNSEIRKKLKSFVVNETRSNMFIKPVISNFREIHAKNDIIVNITTWKGRDNVLPKMLGHLKRQTKKPDRVVLWLSEDEYDKFDLPLHIKKCLEDKLLTDIMWVKRNTYCHKRYECLKYFSDCYNIFMDDDLLYTEKYIEEMINGAKKHPSCVTVYSTRTANYIGYKVLFGNITSYPSHKNVFMGGLCCFPPNMIPYDVFNNIFLRDIFVTTCDESWLRPLLLKHNIKVNALHKYTQFPMIDDTQNNSMWNKNKKMYKSLCREKERMFFNSIIINNVVGKIKSEFPKMNIDKWCLSYDENTESKINKIIKMGSEKDFDNLNIEQPQTWCEKMQWLKLFDDMNFMKIKCADKIRLHQYCFEKLGKDICVPILKVYDSPDDVDFSELPEKFVLKCNHGWNMNIIFDGTNNILQDECSKKLYKWLHTKFGEKTCEFHYLNINSKCYAEKYFENKNQKSLTDYKFLCFEGKPTYVQVLNGRHTSDFHLNYYNMDFDFVDICRCDIRNDSSKLDKKPNNFELMKEYATKLSEDFHFVRVDFYEVDGEVYLGELTFTPATGFIKWTEQSIDKMFGDMIVLPNVVNFQKKLNNENKINNKKEGNTDGVSNISVGYRKKSSSVKRRVVTRHSTFMNTY